MGSIQRKASKGIDIVTCKLNICMENKYISEKIIQVVKNIVIYYPDVVFCGSFGLVLNGKLEREVKDIDVLVAKSYYNQGGFFDKLRVSNSCADSAIFMVGDEMVRSFKLKFDNDVKVDVLYNESEKVPDFKEIIFDGIKIRVENPEGAINAKLKYVRSDKFPDVAIKHIKDLIYMEVDKHKIIDAIDNSSLVERSPENEGIMDEEALDF